MRKRWQLKPFAGAGDFLLYLSGSLVVALVAIIRLPVFTSYFSPEEFGFFSLVSITYTYLSVALYTWISSCLYRFYNEYREARNTRALYVNALFLFGISTAVLLGITVVWYTLSSGAGVRTLLLPALAAMVSAQAVSMALVVYKLRGFAWQYNLLQAIQALTAFLIVLPFLTGSHASIRVLFSAQAGVNLALLVWMGVAHRRAWRRTTAGMISGPLLMKLIRYGAVGLASAVGVYVLIYSDRYIISLYHDISRVGIYNQVYQIGQVSVYFLVTVYFNAITPGFNRLLTGYTADRYKTLAVYVQDFLVLAVPVAFYVALFARDVAAFLLGEAFRQGYGMIPWIVAGTFFYGLTQFNETKMKFEARFAPVLWGMLLACMINAGLNFLLVPRYGYEMAAMATFVAYFVLFLIYYRGDRFFYLQDARLRRVMLWIAAILLLQGVFDFLLRRWIVPAPGKWFTLGEGVVFLLLYAIAAIRLKLIMPLPAEE
jgi:O-antigen/teichoic acid export membrane protein